MSRSKNDCCTHETACHCYVPLDQVSASESTEQKIEKHDRPKRSACDEIFL